MKLSKSDSPDQPPSVEPDEGPRDQLDYSKLPRDLEFEFFKSGRPLDIMWEIERAKKHPGFDSFLVWLYKEYDDLPSWFEFGTKEGDLIEDLKDFMAWLVKSGNGKMADGGATDFSDPRMHHKNHVLRDMNVLVYLHVRYFFKTSCCI